MSELPSDKIPYKDFGLTKEEYWECRQNMHTPSFHTDLVFSEEEWGEDRCNVLYFDSDDGIALFSSNNEMFVGTGFSMSVGSACLGVGALEISS